jgi:hypothetical protein
MREATTTTRPPARLRAAAAWLCAATAPGRRGGSWWDLSEFALAALGFLLYFLVRGAVVDRAGEAFANARRIDDLQRALGIAVERDVQQWVLGSELLWRAANFVYFWCDFPLIVAVGVAMFVTRRDCYMLLRDSCLLSGGIALVLYATLPVAPPRLVPELGIVDTLELYANLSYQAQSMQPFVNPYAALPSLHVGWALLLLVAVVRATRARAAWAAAFAVLGAQSVAVVGTGNHFVLDGVAGVVVCLVALGTALWLQRHGYPALRRRLALLAGVASPA